MDNKIIGAVKECIDCLQNENEDIKLPLEELGCPKKEIRRWKGYLGGAWSKIKTNDKEQYYFFQNLVNWICDMSKEKYYKEIYPIEFDFLYWE